jgi:hypothetical protein
MSISASLVKELREKTGAGFMDCKEGCRFHGLQGGPQGVRGQCR